MDCVEHPYTWSSNRTCSYEYTIESGDFLKGTYVRKSKEYTELYFIGPSISSGVNLDSITRDVNVLYKVYRFNMYMKLIFVQVVRDFAFQE